MFPPTTWMPMMSMNDVQDSFNIEHHHDQNHCYHKILWLQLNGFYIMIMMIIKMLKIQFVDKNYKYGVCNIISSGYYPPGNQPLLWGFHCRPYRRVCQVSPYVDLFNGNNSIYIQKIRWCWILFEWVFWWQSLYWLRKRQECPIILNVVWVF